MCDADHIEANVCEIINSTLLQHDKRNKKFQMPTGFIYRHIFFHICARRFSFYVITGSIIEQTEQNKYKTIILPIIDCFRVLIGYIRPSSFYHTDQLAG